MPANNKKGIILFIVTGVVMIVAMLSIIILRIVSSQSRLTHHQVSRIQAQYAAKAGIVYALEKLRLHDADWSLSGTKRMCKQNAQGCNFVEPALPGSIKYVDITISDYAQTGPLAGTRKVSAKANYTY